MREGSVVDGFLVDSRATYFYFQTNKGNTKKELSSFLDDDTIRTEKQYKGEKLSLGVLLKNVNAYRFFETYFQNNRLYLETCGTLKSNRKEDEEESRPDIFSPEGGYFFPFLKCTGTTLGLICIFGVLYEIKRRMSLRKIRAQANDNQPTLK